MAKLRTEGEALASVMSSGGSPMSSWMSDLSMGSEVDQSLHSFSQSQSQQGEALADPEPTPSLCLKDQGSRRGSLEADMLLPSEQNRSERGTPTKDRLRKLPPSMAKTNIQILAGAGSLSSLKTCGGVHPCVAVKPMIIQEPALLSSPTKLGAIKEPGRGSAAAVASMSSEVDFDDPWLRRSMEEGRSKELVCEVKPVRKEVELLKSLSGNGSTDQQDFLKEGE